MSITAGRRREWRLSAASGDGRRRTLPRRSRRSSSDASPAYTARMFHPSRRSYQLGCRCLACRVENATYAASHRIPRGTVDATPARTHVAQLRTLGIGVRQLAALSHVAASQISALLAGRLLTLQPATAAR